MSGAIRLLTEPDALGRWPSGFWHRRTRYTLDHTGFASFRDERATFTVWGPNGRQRLSILDSDESVLLVSRMSWASPGVEFPAKVETCAGCGGTGEVRIRTAFETGFMQICPDCGGSGEYRLFGESPTG